LTAIGIIETDTPQLRKVRLAKVQRLAVRQAPATRSTTAVAVVRARHAIGRFVKLRSRVPSCRRDLIDQRL